MSKPNYKLRIKNRIDKALITGVLLETGHITYLRLSDNDSNTILGYNPAIYSALLRAKHLLGTGDVDKAYEILANIPYTMSTRMYSQADDGTKYVGTNKAYRYFDTLRHFIRMQGLEEGTTKVGQGKIWNNVMVLG